MLLSIGKAKNFELNRNDIQQHSNTAVTGINGPHLVNDSSCGNYNILFIQMILRHSLLRLHDEISTTNISLLQILQLQIWMGVSQRYVIGSNVR
jgi:hypothetical protein